MCYIDETIKVYSTKPTTLWYNKCNIYLKYSYYFYKDGLEQKEIDFFLTTFVLLLFLFSHLALSYFSLNFNYIFLFISFSGSSDRSFGNGLQKYVQRHENV